MENIDKKLMDDKKAILLKAVGKAVFKKRSETKKGINKFSYEYDIGNGLLSRLENGKTDVKITTLFKIAHAFGMKFSDLAILFEKELPDDFDFYL